MASATFRKLTILAPAWMSPSWPYLRCGVGALAVDVLHDLLQLSVHRLKGPVQALAVLAHLQAGDSHAAGVGSLEGE